MLIPFLFDFSGLGGFSFTFGELTNADNLIFDIVRTLFEGEKRENVQMGQIWY